MAEKPVGSELRRTWEAAAPGWAKWEHAFSTSFAEATDVLMDEAGVQPGMRVLDVACGAGGQSLRAAGRVGSDGTVVASDISAAMLEHVRRNAALAGVENIETLECAAEGLPTSLSPFDAAICRMGLMLFPSPPRALEAVWDVLKPGARFAALVFATPAGNPFLAQPMAILMRHAGKPAPAPGTPGLFALGGDGVLEGLMKANGLAGVTTKTLRLMFALPSAGDALQLLQEAAGAYRAVVADLDDQAKARAWDDVRECLARFETEGALETEFEVIVGSGARPA